MKNRLYAINLIIALTSVLCGNALAANITAHIDRNPVMFDESFQLVLEADGVVDDDPDFSVLEKNFDLLSSSTSTSASIINGVFNRKYVWNLTLISKGAGVFTLPSISFGNDSSPALRIAIRQPASGPNAGNRGKQFYLEVETDTKESWVQSQIIYTVRFVRSINVTNPSLNELKTSDPDAIIEKLGKETTYESIRNGVRYLITELKFVVYPQHSGELVFTPMQLQGRISSSSSRSFFDQFMQRGKLKRVSSRSLRVNVKPKPAGIKNSEWLPASDVKLADNWSGDTDKLKVGEPLTRTITINARGLMGVQLPEIELPDIDGLKQYPDQPVTEDKKTPRDIIGVKKIKVALIATKNGQFKLPAIRIPWWNTRTGKKEIAELPEVMLSATGATSTAKTPVRPIVSETATSKAGEKTSPATGFIHIKDNLWAWTSLALAIAWLGTLFALFIKNRHNNVAETQGKTKQPAPALRPLEKAVRASAGSNNAGETKDNLLAWAKARWPEENITSLADITQNCPADLSTSLQTLNAALYGKKQDNWHGSELAQAFDDFRQRKPATSNKQQSVLEPLYKT